MTATPIMIPVYCIDHGAPASRECDPQIARRLETPSNSKSPRSTHSRKIDGATLGRTPQEIPAGTEVTIEVGAGYMTGRRRQQERATRTLRGIVTVGAVSMVELETGSQDWVFGIAGVRIRADYRVTLNRQAAGRLNDDEYTAARATWGVDDGGDTSAILMAEDADAAVVLLERDPGVVAYAEVEGPL